MTRADVVATVERLIRRTVERSRREILTEMIAAKTDPDEIDRALEAIDERNEAAIVGGLQELEALLLTREGIARLVQTSAQRGGPCH